MTCTINMFSGQQNETGFTLKTKATFKTNFSTLVFLFHPVTSETVYHFEKYEERFLKPKTAIIYSIVCKIQYFRPSVTIRNLQNGAVSTGILSISKI